MRVGILQPGYLPWLGFFEQLARVDRFVLLDDVQYDKGGWRNRNRVKTAAGVRWLTVPVLAGGDPPPRLDEVRIDNRLPWRRKHLDTLRQSYARAPFAAAHLPLLEEALGREWERLAELDAHLIRGLAAALGIDAGKMVLSSALGVAGSATERLLGICRRLGATSFYEGAAGRDYLDEGAFRAAGIALEYQGYRHPVYNQLHGAFVPYLSVVDLLLTCGPQSLSILTGAAGGDAHDG